MDVCPQDWFWGPVCKSPCVPEILSPRPVQSLWVLAVSEMQLTFYSLLRSKNDKHPHPCRAKWRPPKRYVHILMPGTCKHDLTWTNGLCRGDPGEGSQMRASGLSGRP